MSDIMTPIPFGKLMDWIFQELKKEGTVFGTKKAFRAGEESLSIFKRNLETPIGPAAGPHTQLAQNMIASYYAGSRFFELKTVQIMDGEELSKCVNKPCILAREEGYNCEWSTELYVPQALGEYIKAWFALHVLAKELNLGKQDGFQFNMSVGYDLAGIQSPKINYFIDTMMEAKEDAVYQECKTWLLENVNQFTYFTKEDVEAIPSNICNSVTISTLHGCPPSEIERIAAYLLEGKHLNTFVKCNPTLLGYEFARRTMDDMGYDDMVFGDFHFKDDLQYEEAVPMLTRLMELSQQRHLEFGVKITNTFPVDVTKAELPSEEMYMSGKALFPLSISLAAKLSKEFQGKLRISYSGGADYFNIKKIVAVGIWPVTMATTFLKPGGYGRTKQIAELLAKQGYKEFTGIDVAELEKLATEAVTDIHHMKPVKSAAKQKIKRNVPLIDCFIAPCQEGCPIHQDITTYMNLVGEKKYVEALQVITEKNPLPFITGTICAHNCMNQCTRNFYEQPVNIRRSKLEAAEGGYEAWLKNMPTISADVEKKYAVIGGGPAGLSAGYFLAKRGVQVTIFEKMSQMGGVVRNVIPDFRIGHGAIDKDVALIKAMGVKMITGKEITSLEQVKEFDGVIVAIGATEKATLKLRVGDTVNAIDFLAEFKETRGNVNIGRHVVVIGGGNTAMDTARAAKRNLGVEKVSLVYRRTKRFMPADQEELEMALKEGVEFMELLTPVEIENGMLTCKRMMLVSTDKNDLPHIEETEEVLGIKADTVIAAVGEQVPASVYKSFGIQVDETGHANVNPDTLESSVAGVYVIGDGLYGPATVVEGIRDGRKAADAILPGITKKDNAKTAEEQVIYERRGVLNRETQCAESSRCLGCDSICENCVEVCPNRANISVRVQGLEQHQIIHIDSMCNECGNCEVFCPYESAPYLDKFTLFANETDMKKSENNGFVVVNKLSGIYKVRLCSAVLTCELDQRCSSIPEEITRIIATVIKDYSYML